AGWDGDISNGGQDPTGNHGSLRFSHLEIAWSGCGERWPGGQVFGCWGQEEGGYGDGLGTGSGGGDWVFEDSHIHNNTQDGLDLLHLDPAATVTMRRVRAEGNAGNQLKASGQVLIENSTIDGSCASFTGVGNMRPEDQCRATGDSIMIALVDGKPAAVRDSTLRGQGGCLITGSGGGAGAVLTLTGNTLIGGPRWDDPGRLTCGYFLYESKGRVNAEGNHISGVKASTTMQDACRNAEAYLHDSDHACEWLKGVVKRIRQ
ncbi:MAG: hypothetical protein ACHP7D_03370, partial [Lysobacterales bacterium]